MKLALRKLRLFWVRYLMPDALEKDVEFQKTMDALTRRGLRVAGALGLLGISIYLLAHLSVGRRFVWTFSSLVPGANVVIWNKVLIGCMSIAALVLAHVRPRVRPGRILMSLFLVVTALALILEDVSRGDFTFTAGWLTLVMLITVGTVPFQPWQTGMLCLVIGVLYAYYASLPTALINSLSAGVPASRLIYVGLVTFLCTSMSASLYASRYEQYRSLRRVERLKERLSTRSEALQHALERGRQMQDQLVQKEKLASLGQLTAGIAHEIKNPLNFVNNFSELSRDLMDELVEELEANPEKPIGDVLEEVQDVLRDLRTNTEKVAEHGKRADGIVRSMLAHSRTTPGDRRPVDLNKLADEYVGLAFHGMRAQHSGFNVDIVRDFDEELESVAVVPEEIGRVFLNLMDNAFDAVRARTLAEQDRYEPRVRLATHRTPDGAVITIADNGTGIPGDIHERIFEPFFTTKPTGEGTGLGLSLSYDIITAGHGGTMDVETVEGVGTTFTLELPSVPPEQEA